MIKPAEKIYAPCCGVFAAFLAHPEHEDFDPVFDEARDALGRTKGWRGRMAWSEVKFLLSSFGVQHENFGRAVGAQIGAAVESGYFEAGVKYVVMIAGHFLTIRNGLCYDQSYPNGVEADRYFAKRRVIKYAIKIL